MSSINYYKFLHSEIEIQNYAGSKSYVPASIRDNILLPLVYDLRIIPRFSVNTLYIVIRVTVVSLLDRNRCTVSGVKTTACVRMAGIKYIFSRYIFSEVLEVRKASRVLFLRRVFFYNCYTAGYFADISRKARVK